MSKMDSEVDLSDDLAAVSGAKDMKKSLLYFEALNVIVTKPAETEEESYG